MKQNKERTHRNMESVFPTPPGHGVYPGVRLIWPGSLHQRNQTFPFPLGVNSNRFLVIGGPCVNFPTQG